MRKIREVLRLKGTSQLSNRTIATSCSIARSTVAECLERASKAGLSWPLPDSMDDAELERLLYIVPLSRSRNRMKRVLPELQRRCRARQIEFVGVNLRSVIRVDLRYCFLLLTINLFCI